MESLKKGLKCFGCVILCLLLFIMYGIWLLNAPKGTVRLGPITDLGSFGGQSIACGINDAGDVFGRSEEGFEGQWFWFVWRDGHMEKLGPQFSGEVVAVNHRGEAAVDTLDRHRNHQAQVWTHTEHIDVGTLGGPESIPTGIDEKGQVSGIAQTASGRWHRFLWLHGNMRDLGPFDHPVPHVYHPEGRFNKQGELISVDDYNDSDLGSLGGGGTRATDINDRRHVVGTSLTRGGERHVFLWIKGKMIDTGISSDSDVALNNLDQVVGKTIRAADNVTLQGHSRDIRTWGHAYSAHFLWQGGRRRYLEDLIPKGTDVRLREARAINDRGQITGVGMFHGWEHAYLMDTGASGDQAPVKP